MRKPLLPQANPLPFHDTIHVTVYATGRADPATGAWERVPLERIPIGSHLDRPGLLVVQMESTSMEPIIRRKAYVGIDSQDCALRDDEIYAFDIAKEGLTLRRVRREPGNGVLSLQAENPLHPAQRFNSDAAGLTPIGKVVWVIQEI